MQRSILLIVCCPIQWMTFVSIIMIFNDYNYDNDDLSLLWQGQSSWLSPIHWLTYVHKSSSSSLLSDKTIIRNIIIIISNDCCILYLQHVDCCVLCLIANSVWCVDSFQYLWVLKTGWRAKVLAYGIKDKNSFAFSCS